MTRHCHQVHFWPLDGDYEAMAAEAMGFNGRTEEAYARDTRLMGQLLKEVWLFHLPFSISML